MMWMVDGVDYIFALWGRHMWSSGISSIIHRSIESHLFSLNLPLPP